MDYIEGLLFLQIVKTISLILVETAATLYKVMEMESDLRSMYAIHFIRKVV